MLEKLNKTELEILRQSLPKGAAKHIADTVGLEVSSVKQILLKPERFNYEVIVLAIEMSQNVAAAVNTTILEFKSRIKATA